MFLLPHHIQRLVELVGAPRQETKIAYTAQQLDWDYVAEPFGWIDEIAKLYQRFLYQTVAEADGLRLLPPQFASYDLLSALENLKHEEDEAVSRNNGLANPFPIVSVLLKTPHQFAVVNLVKAHNEGLFHVALRTAECSYPKLDRLILTPAIAS